ncbi:hypothetical protein [uncultured Phascolarctobacterium sp.]|uniref:hypothetical protein n=1 Tax=uncultured Phascolarctobacterium sp. TaxID=512296 RepID=UPI0025D9F5D5|nr:hypothetical protein [uncultured Phascolarctobacterium sp.]
MKSIQKPTVVVELVMDVLVVAVRAVVVTDVLAVVANAVLAITVLVAKLQYLYGI